MRVRLFLAHRQRMQYRWMMLGFEIRGKGQKLGIIYCYGLAARPLPVQECLFFLHKHPSAVVFHLPVCSFRPLASYLSVLRTNPKSPRKWFASRGPPLVASTFCGVSSCSATGWEERPPFSLVSSYDQNLPANKLGYREQQQQNIMLLQNPTRGDLNLFLSSFATNGKSLVF